MRRGHRHRVHADRAGRHPSHRHHAWRGRGHDGIYLPVSADFFAGRPLRHVQPHVQQRHPRRRCRLAVHGVKPVGYGQQHRPGRPFHHGVPLGRGRGRPRHRDWKRADQRLPRILFMEETTGLPSLSKIFHVEKGIPGAGAHAGTPDVLQHHAEQRVAHDFQSDDDRVWIRRPFRPKRGRKAVHGHHDAFDGLLHGHAARHFLQLRTRGL